jgi:hypothetical protein
MGAWGRSAEGRVVSTPAHIGGSPPVIADCAFPSHSPKFTHHHQSKSFLPFWFPDSKKSRIRKPENQEM